MPQKATVTQQASGNTETLQILLLSELIIAALSGIVKQEQINQVTAKLEDMIVIALPDTGQAKFVGSHEIKSGKQAGKMSKATFVVAELGSSFAGEDLAGLSQSLGDHAGLPLTAKVSIIASPPNTAGKTLDEALNRKPKLEAVAPTQEPKTGTDN